MEIGQKVSSDLEYRYIVNVQLIALYKEQQQVERALKLGQFDGICFVLYSHVLRVKGTRIYSKALKPPRPLNPQRGLKKPLVFCIKVPFGDLGACRFHSTPDRRRILTMEIAITALAAVRSITITACLIIVEYIRIDFNTGLYDLALKRLYHTWPDLFFNN